MDEREDADEEAPLPSSAIFSCAAVGVALSANTGEGEEETEEGGIEDSYTRLCAMLRRYLL